MLELQVLWNGERKVVEFEHSLLSVSKWESDKKKAFLSSTPHPREEMLDYFSDMIITPGIPREVVYVLSPKQFETISNYISETRTASIVNDGGGDGSGKGETVTSELMYYWLASCKIPFHPVETWHLSRLMMLVRMTSYKNRPATEKDRMKTSQQWAAENERRLAMYNTTG